MRRAFAVVAIALAASAAALAAPGDVDPTWGNRGVVRTYLFRADAGALVYDLVEERGDVLAAGGGFYPEYRAPALVRYRRDGRLDRSFGRGGVVRGRGFVGLPGWNAAVVLADGRILTASGAFTENVDNDTIVIARFTRDGRLDTTFGKRGRLRYRFGGIGCPQRPVALQRQGPKVLLLADVCVVTAVVRLLPNGRLDRTFGKGGRTFAQPLDESASGSSVPYELAQQRDGKLVVGIAGDEGQAALVRLDRDGRLDPSFGANGTARFGIGYGRRLDPLGGLVEQPDGKLLLVACDAERRTLIFRFDARGRVDRSFGKAGLVPLTGHGCVAQSERAAGGKIVAIARDALLRLDVDGALDATFGTGGAVPLPTPDALLVARDGTIVTGRAVRLAHGKGGFELRRFLP